MIVISHRGYWKNPQEKNSPVAFRRSFSLGFGTETDIRDFDGQLVISHDIATKKCISLEDFIAIYLEEKKSLPLALNIKADGLQFLLAYILKKYRVLNYFVFDMSVPDGLVYIRQGLSVFTRESEYEVNPSFYNEAKGVWLDEFHSHWISHKTLEKHLDAGKDVCIVSPDLHGRDHKTEWKDYLQFEKTHGFKNLMLCTDYPEDAKRFFCE